MELGVMMRIFLKTFMVLLLPMFPDENGYFYENSAPQIIDDYAANMGHGQQKEDQDVLMDVLNNDNEDWVEIEIKPDIESYLGLKKWKPKITSNQNQLPSMADIKQFEEVLVIDGNLQSSEIDEFIYHESLAHPALLIHDEPKMIFIMGGGGGFVAREVLKHKNIEKVIMCDTDWEVFSLCREDTAAMDKNFHDPRFQIVYSDAEEELERSKEKFDVIIGDLTHHTESRLSKNLYTKSFYEKVVKPKLNHKGIFVTQAGQAGIFSYKSSFLPILSTLKQVFTYVIAYTAQVPSIKDSYGWIMASDEPLQFDVELFNNRIKERINGELFYLNGNVIVASTILNETLKTLLMEEII